MDYQEIDLESKDLEKVLNEITNKIYRLKKKYSNYDGYSNGHRNMNPDIFKRANTELYPISTKIDEITSTLEELLKEPGAVEKDITQINVLTEKEKKIKLGFIKVTDDGNILQESKIPSEKEYRFLPIGKRSQYVIYYDEHFKIICDYLCQSHHPSTNGKGECYWYSNGKNTNIDGCIFDKDLLFDYELYIDNSSGPRPRVILFSDFEKEEQERKEKLEKEAQKEKEKLEKEEKRKKEMIKNPKTGRWVKKNSKLGKELLDKK
jgi:hypothetical protein